MVTLISFLTPYYYINNYACADTYTVEIVSKSQWNASPTTLKPNCILLNINLPTAVLKAVKNEKLHQVHYGNIPW